LLNIIFTHSREPVPPKGSVLPTAMAKVGKGRLLAVENNVIPVLRQLPAA
jgi:hypothetical protein